MEKTSAKVGIVNNVFGALAVAYICAGWVVGIIVTLVIKVGETIAQKVSIARYRVSKQQQPD